MIYLLLKKFYLCGHSIEGLKLWLYQDILPARRFQVMSMKHVLGFNDSLVSCYRANMALFQIEFHVPIVC